MTVKEEGNSDLVSGQGTPCGSVEVRLNLPHRAGAAHAATSTLSVSRRVDPTARRTNPTRKLYPLTLTVYTATSTSPEVKMWFTNYEDMTEYLLNCGIPSGSFMLERVTVILPVIERVRL